MSRTCTLIESKAGKIVTACGLAGAVLALIFSALGGVSPEPSDHPSWLADPPLAVALVYQALVFLCLPAFIFCSWTVFPILFFLTPTEPGWRAGYTVLHVLCFYVAFPVIQGVLYGAAAWLVVRITARRLQFSLARLLRVVTATAGLIGVGMYVNSLWKGWYQPSVSVGQFLVLTLLASGLAHFIARKLLNRWVSLPAAMFAGGIAGACFTSVAYDDPLLLGLLGMGVGVCWLLAFAPRNAGPQHG